MSNQPAPAATYNPSQQVKAVILNRILLVLGFLGLFIAGFLSLAHVMNAEIPCGRNSGCDVVTNHPTYGSFLTVPIAYWGLLGYLVLTVLAAFRAINGLQKTKALIMPGYFVAAGGTLASLYLQYASLFVIGRLCPWCMASAITMVITLIVYALLAQHVDEASSDSLGKDPVGFTSATAMLGLVILALGVSGFTLNKSNKSQALQTIDPQKIASIELIPKDAHSYGAADAPITILEFADIYCPACRRTSPRIKEFVDEHPGRIRLVYRHFPLVDKHPLSLPAALMSEAAAEKGKFFDYLIAVMKSGGDEELGVDDLYMVARSVGLDDKALRKRMDNPKDPIYEKVQRDLKASDGLGLQVTPTMIMMVDGKVKYIASSNDIFETLQKSPFKEIIAGQPPTP